MSDGPRALSASELREAMSYAGVYLIAFEMLNASVIDRVRDFVNFPGLPSRFESEIAEYPGRGVRQKCVGWLQGLGALRPEDGELVERAAIHRNEIAHEFARLAIGQMRVNVELLSEVVQLGLRLDRWWIRNVDFAIDPEGAWAEVSDDEILPGSHMILSYVFSKLFPGVSDDH